MRIMPSHDMDLKLRTMLIINFKSGYIDFVIGSVLFIPLFGDFRSIFFIEYGIKIGWSGNLGGNFLYPLCSIRLYSFVQTGLTKP